MQNEAPGQLETQVVDCLKLLLAKYQHLTELVDPMVAKQKQGLSIHDEMDTLQSARNELALLHQRAAILQKAYRKSHKKSSQAVNQLTDQTAQLIKTLVTKIDKLESFARESHRRLIPVIDESVRINQMKQAYRQPN